MWNFLSSQPIHALLCLSSWSAEGFVRSADIQTIIVVALEEIKGDNDIKQAQDWDMINVD